jgi:hypothetical protein
MGKRSLSLVLLVATRARAQGKMEGALVGQCGEDGDKREVSDFEELGRSEKQENQDACCYIPTI